MALTRHLLALALAACIVAGAACSSRAKDDGESGAPRLTLVGRIASIPPHRNFVLIESYGPWQVPTGTILTTRGTDGRTANLRVTGESINPYAAADLQSGDAAVGDAVYQLPKPTPTPAPTPAATPTPEPDATHEPEPEPPVPTPETT
jgi:hypothetical protein